MAMEDLRWAIHIVVALGVFFAGLPTNRTDEDDDLVLGKLAAQRTGVYALGLMAGRVKDLGNVEFSEQGILFIAIAVLFAGAALKLGGSNQRRMVYGSLVSGVVGLAMAVVASGVAL